MYYLPVQNIILLMLACSEYSMLSASRVNPVNYLKLQQHLLLSFLGKNLGKISSREKNFQPLLQLVWENCDSQSRKLNQFHILFLKLVLHRLMDLAKKIVSL